MSDLVQVIKETVTQRRLPPEISVTTSSEAAFGSRQILTLSLLAVPAQWVFKAAIITTGSNSGLSITREFLGQALRLSYDRLRVLRTPDYIAVDYRLEQRQTGEQVSGRLVLPAAICRMSTGLLSR